MTASCPPTQPTPEAIFVCRCGHNQSAHALDWEECYGVNLVGCACAWFATVAVDATNHRPEGP